MMHRIGYFIVVTLLAAVVSTRTATADDLDLNVQHRDSAGVASLESLSIDPTKTAIVVVDMWDSHTDPTAASRDQSLIPRLNQTLDVARQLGMQIIFAPSGVLGSASLKNNARRTAVTSLPYAAKPSTGTAVTSDLPPNSEHDPTGNRSMGIPPNVSVAFKPMPTTQDPDIVIRNQSTDWIIDCNNNQELWNVMSYTGVTKLIYTGVHTNWCVWNRNCGIKKSASALGVQSLLLRDLTDAYGGNGKNAATGAADYSWTFDRGTRETVAWYEQNAFGTIDASQILAKDSANRYAYANRVANEKSALAYWRMDGWNGDEQIHDVKETQAAWNSEKVTMGQTGAIHGDADTAAKFDGTAAVIVAPKYQANLPLASATSESPLVNLSKGSFSVEAWVQVDKLTSGSQWIVSHDAGSNAITDFLLGINSTGKFEFITRQNKANDIVGSIQVSADDIAGDSWFHVVAAQSLAADSVELYVNGVLVGSKSGVDGTTIDIQSSLQIGSRGATTVSSTGVATSGMGFFNGSIDEVAIYSDALSAQTVMDHYLLGTTGKVPEPTSMTLLIAATFVLAAFVVKKHKYNRNNSCV